MGTTLAKIIMSKTFVIVLACLVAAAVAQETMIMSDFNLLRSVANATGAAKTLPASPLDVKDNAGLVGFSLSADGKTLYGANVNTNKVLAFDLSKDTISYSVLAGSDTAPTAINTTLNENSGTSVQFMSISDMAMGADGNLYVLDSGFGVICKVTPAGVATHFAGASFASDMWTANAAGDGVATVAGFTADKLTQIAASSTGIFMIVDNGVLKEVAADGTVTTKSEATASPGVNGVGTSASFDVINDMKFSADGNSLYVAEAKIATPNLVEGAFGDATNVVRKVDMSNFGVSTLAGNVPTAAGSSADGTGTSVFFSAISSLSVSSAGDVFATEVCNTGSVVRKISPDGTTATHASDLNTAGCKQPKVVTDFTALVQQGRHGYVCWVQLRLRLCYGPGGVREVLPHWRRRRARRLRRPQRHRQAGQGQGSPQDQEGSDHPVSVCHSCWRLGPGRRPHHCRGSPRGCWQRHHGD